MVNPRRAEAKMGTSRLISIVVLAGFGLSLSGCLSLVDERGHIDFDLVEDLTRNLRREVICNFMKFQPNVTNLDV